MEVDAPPPEQHDLAATSDAGSGGGIPFPCCADEVGGMKSSHDSVKTLLRRYRKNGVGKDFKPLLAKDGWEPSCETLPEGSNIICVFDSMLEAGVEFPLHDFYVDYLRHYSIAPSQLTPNAWRYLVGFVKLCDRVRVPPTVAVFQHYFSIKMCPNSSKRWYIVPSPSHRLFKPESLPSNEGWKKWFFFLESTAAPWRCPKKCGTPEPASFADPEVMDAEKEATERLESWKEERSVSLMKLLHDAERDAATAASMPPSKKYRSLGAITSPHSEKLTISKESTPPSDDGNEHFSASRMLMDAYKAVQRIEKELHNAKDELREERTKHATDVARMEEELGAATANVAQLEEKLQAAEAGYAKVADAKHEAEVRQLMDELREEKAKHLSKLHQFSEDRRVSEAEHETKVLQLREELQAERAERAAEVKAIRVECQRKVMQEKHTRSAEMVEMLSKRYEEGRKDMVDLAVIFYPSIDPALLMPKPVADGSIPPGFPPHQGP